MSNSQYKKERARLFNLHKAEKLAYEMDRQLFPPAKTARDKHAARISKAALVSGIGLVFTL